MREGTPASVEAVAGKGRARIAALALMLVAADQASKSAAHSLLSSQGLRLWRFLSLTPTRNTGGVFGILKGYPHLFTAAALLISLGAVAWAWRSAGRSRLLDLSLALLLAGALGNVADRLILGYVRDFVDLGFWPAFNLADACLSTSVALLSLWAWLSSRKKGHTGSGFYPPA